MGTALDVHKDWAVAGAHMRDMPSPEVQIVETGLDRPPLAPGSTKRLVIDGTVGPVREEQWITTTAVHRSSIQRLSTFARGVRGGAPCRLGGWLRFRCVR